MKHRPAFIAAGVLAVIALVASFAIWRPWHAKAPAIPHAKTANQAKAAPSTKPILPPAPPTGPDELHKVVRGDRLWVIAREYFNFPQTVAAYWAVINMIADYNCIKDPNKIYVGQTIKIPRVSYQEVNATFTTAKLQKALRAPKQLIRSVATEQPKAFPRGPVRATATMEAPAPIFAAAPMPTLPAITSPNPTLEFADSSTSSVSTEDYVDVALPGQPVKFTSYRRDKDHAVWYITWLMPGQLPADIHVKPDTTLPALYVEGQTKDRKWETREMIAVKTGRDTNGRLYFATRLPEKPTTKSALAIAIDGRPVELTSGVLLNQGKALNQPVQFAPTNKRGYSLLLKNFRKKPNVLLRVGERIFPYVLRSGMAYRYGGFVGVGIVQVQTVVGKFMPQPPSVTGNRAPPVETVISGEMRRLDALQKRIERLEQELARRQKEKP